MYKLKKLTQYQLDMSYHILFGSQSVHTLYPVNSKYVKWVLIYSWYTVAIFSKRKFGGAESRLYLLNPIRFQKLNNFSHNMTNNFKQDLKPIPIHLYMYLCKVSKFTVGNFQHLLTKTVALNVRWRKKSQN